MNVGDFAYYVMVALALLYFTRQVLGAVGFRIYWGVFIGFAVVIGYFTLRYCINWDVVTGFKEVGQLIVLGIAVLGGVVLMGKLFLSAGHEWIIEENIARWRRRMRDSKRHWWNFL